MAAAGELTKYRLETEGREPMAVTAAGIMSAIEAAFAYWQYTYATEIRVMEEDGTPVATMNIALSDE